MFICREKGNVSDPICSVDEVVLNLDQQTAEHFAKTINKLKGKVTMLFITHQIPRGLQVDEVFSFGDDHQHNTKVKVVGEENQ